MAASKEQALNDILKHYTDVRLTKNGFVISFDTTAHAMEAFKSLTDVLKEADKTIDRE